MRIKELSQTVGIPVETIRYYERAGLMPRAIRTENNYRQYRLADVEHLRFIRNCRALDMNLDEIRELMTFIDQAQDQAYDNMDCRGVHAIVEEHLAHVQLRLKSLKVLEKQLKHLLQACGHDSAAQACDIVKELFSEKNENVNPSAHGVHTT